MPSVDRSSIDAPYQIIVEGSADEQFVARLLSHRNIDGFQVACGIAPTQPRTCCGKDGFKYRLLALDAHMDLHPDSIKGILIVTDSDSDSLSSFDDAKKEVKKAKMSLSLPTNPGEICTGPPKFSIVTLPWNRVGHLDTLLYESVAESHRDLTRPDGPIETFCNSTTHIRVGWTEGNVSKLKLRCLLAMEFRKDPGKALTFVLNSSDCPFDFGNPMFDDFANFFREFRS